MNQLLIQTPGAFPVQKYMKFEPASSRTSYRKTRLVRGSSVVTGKVGRVVSIDLLFFKKKRSKTTNDEGNKEKKVWGEK